ncbi:hypothetical protein [Streptomyces hygroscopicus]
MSHPWPDGGGKPWPTGRLPWRSSLAVAVVQLSGPRAGQAGSVPVG